MSDNISNYNYGTYTTTSNPNSVDSNLNSLNDNQLNLATGIPGPVGLPYTGGGYVSPTKKSNSRTGISGTRATGFATSDPITITEELISGMFSFTVNGTNVESNKSGCILFPQPGTYILTVDALTSGLGMSFLTVNTFSLDGTINIQTDLISNSQRYQMPVVNGVFIVKLEKGSGSICFGYESEDLGATLGAGVVFG